MAILYFIIVALLSLFLNKKMVIGLILVNEFLLIGWTTLEILPQFVFQGYDVIIIILFFRFFSIRYFFNVPIFKVFTILFIYSIATFFFHKTSIQIFFMGFRLLFTQLLLIYIILALDLTPSFFKKIINFLVIISSAEVVISFYQYIVNGGPGDWAGGSLGSGGTNQLMLFQISIIILLTDQWMRGTGLSLKRIVALLFLSSPLIFGSSKAGYFILPIVISILILNKQLLNGFSFKVLFLFGVLGVLGTSLFFSYVAERDKEVLSDSDNIENYNSGIIDDDTSIARGDILNLTILFLEQNKLLITGTGLGNLYYSKSLSGKYITPNTVYLSSRSGIAKVLGELGIIGSLIFILIYALIIKQSTVLRKYKNPIISSFGFTILLITLFFANAFYSGLPFKGASNILLILLFGYVISIEKQFSIHLKKV